MAATVKPIEAKTIHLIQSGQVIVDLCSVVKELVENSLDADASAIELRFKNNGLDEIEVQDNGTGIAPANYESVALKHHTSKLSSYNDLSSLSTFGFRGEALSSLCALSDFHVITAQENEAPKGNRLDFESSGKLKSTSIVACQKGTTVSVSNLFDNLPVRRKELTKNIKREYAKVVGLLNAYGCISTSVKFTVKNSMPRGKSMTVFATQSNATTRENIANIYGAKTLSALAPLDLEFDFHPTPGLMARSSGPSTKVMMKGHISKPVYGEGRQAPDRQMFFVNGRPCGLPQIAKAINEVYKSFNVSQSPFIFADFQLDTNAYDVNVSPDKRSIFLHNATALTDAMKTELTAMFDGQDQTVPQSQLRAAHLPAFKQLNIRRNDSVQSVTSNTNEESEDIAETDGVEDDSSMALSVHGPNKLLREHFDDFASTRRSPSDGKTERGFDRARRDGGHRVPSIAEPIGQRVAEGNAIHEESDRREMQEEHLDIPITEDSSEREDIRVRDFNARLAEQQTRNSRQHQGQIGSSHDKEPAISSISQSPKPSSPGIVQNAFDRMRPRRMQPEFATITIGDKIITKVIGSGTSREEEFHPRHRDQEFTKRKTPNHNASIHQFSQRLGQFTAPGTQVRLELETIDADNDEDELVDAHISRGADVANAPSPVDVGDGFPSSARGRSSSTSASHGNRSGHADSEPEGEDDVRTEEEARVAKLIALAEQAAVKAENQSEKRAVQALKGGRTKEAIATLQIVADMTLDTLKSQLQALQTVRSESHARHLRQADQMNIAAETDEEQLSLTVARTDFARMHVVGQFNLGFILAVRDRIESTEGSTRRVSARDELFIIDQHASDEKFNFERLQAETTVGNQRMVRPVTLDLTAVEEETLLESTEALEKNGFIINIDVSGDRPVGQRCDLVSLPLSKEVVFNTKDLDELIYLLSESPMLADSTFVPRPSKVRKMFAMRACRSSIMIGKTLSQRQMSTVLQHMGEIDKPWNCPHGRPTMRHLASLDTLDSSLWREGDGVVTGQGGSKSASPDVWKRYAGSAG